MSARDDGQSDFQSFVAQERQRLERRRQQLNAKKAELDEQLQAIEREFAAITAYEQVKAGKSSATSQSGSRRTGRRSGRRQEVLNLIKGVSTGLTRGDLLERLNVKGERREEQSVSNALSALKRAGHLDQRDGKYFAV